jgi:hypothetical protein
MSFLMLAWSGVSLFLWRTDWSSNGPNEYIKREKLYKKPQECSAMNIVRIVVKVAGTVGAIAAGLFVAAEVYDKSDVHGGLAITAGATGTALLLGAIWVPENDDTM